MATQNQLTMGMANAVDLFIVKPNTTGDGYDYYTMADTGILTKVVSPALPEKAIRIDAIEQNQIEFQADGTLKCTLTQYLNNARFRTLLKINRPTKSGERPDQEFVDGQVIKGTAGTFNVVAIIYGNLEDDFAETSAMKRLVWTAFGNLATTSGSVTAKKGTYNQPTFEFDSTMVEIGKSVSVPMTCYDDAIVTVTADTTIASGTSFEETYYTVPV